MNSSVTLPDFLRPRDGRFGSGPSKVRVEQVQKIISNNSPMGTSHRKPGVKNLVERIQVNLSDLYHLPDGYEVVLGNGGASLLWDAIAFNVAITHTQSAVFGEFSRKASKAVARVPWIETADVCEVEAGSVALCSDDVHVDTYLYPHNETSTGAFSPVIRYGKAPNALTLVDGTSSAGGVSVDIEQTDMYYFSPQKCFGADGGLWLAIMSPAAIERVSKMQESRWIPDILNLQLAINNSRKHQTLNTPSVANLIMLADQTEWMLNNGGLEEMENRTRASSSVIYSWADERDFASPFITKKDYRSPVVATIDFDENIDASSLSSFLREYNIVDIEPYRSLGRNQLRIGTFPSVETADVEALLACIDWAIDNGVGTKK